MSESDSMTVKQYRPLQEALDEVERELNVRCRCFPRWVADGRVSRTDAQDRLDRLATAYTVLEAIMGQDMNAAVADVMAKVEERQKKQGKS